jgi:hypothetical protein
VLDHLMNDKPYARQETLSCHLAKIARLDGYLARTSDPRPGNTVIWRGLPRLTHIALGVMLRAEIAGNCKLDPTGTIDLPNPGRSSRNPGLRIDGAGPPMTA